MNSPISTTSRLPRFERALWLMPAAFSIHIYEEYSGGFSRYVVDTMHGSPMPTPLFLMNNAVFMAILLSLSVWAAKSKSRLSALMLMCWASGNLFWDFFVHLGYTVSSGLHSPGLISASLLYYPLPPIVSAIALRQGRMSWADTFIAYLVGGTLMFLVVWGGVYHFAT